MKPSGVTVTLDKSDAMIRAVRELTRSEVLVGIPTDKGERSNGDTEAVTNAQLGFIHENGSPARNIPARPFLTPGIKAVGDQIIRHLRDAGKQALEGVSGGVAASLDRAGLVAQNSVRAQFVDNDWEPLTESTLNKRPPAKRDEEGKVAHQGKSRRERGATNPLIDSGQLRKAITYVVRKR